MSGIIPAAQLDDGQLALRCAERDPIDEEAWRVFHERHYEWVWRKVRLKFHRNEGDTQDVVQEVFLRSFKSLRLYDPQQTNIRTYLMKMINWCYIDALRKLPREESVDIDEDLRILSAKSAADGRVLLLAASWIVERAANPAESAVMHDLIAGQTPAEIARRRSMELDRVYATGRKLRKILRESGDDPRLGSGK